jgi:hypothetical protein
MGTGQCAGLQRRRKQGSDDGEQAKR